MPRRLALPLTAVLLCACGAAPQMRLRRVVLYQNGIAQFEALGCGTCHIASLPLNSTRYTLPSRNGGPPVTVDLLEEGAMPRLGKQVDGRVLVPLFSDLKRHQMGPGLAEPRAYRGVNADRFRTPPLWGVQRSRPYLHDGRAVTMEAAVLAHGGEAQEARDAFAAMSVEERAPLRMFLAVMVRARHYEAP